MYVEWKENFSVGKPLLDDHHRRLFEIIDKLQKGLREDIDSSELSNILDDLQAYTDYHFRAEEKEMEEVVYPHLEKHKKEHEDLKARVLDYRERGAQDNKALSAKLLRFLIKWWEQHICGEDMKYVPYLKGDTQNLLNTDRIAPPSSRDG